MKKRTLRQGDIIIINQNQPALVVSRDIFNESGKAILCPIVNKASNSPLHVPVRLEADQGVVLCEQVQYADMTNRYWKYAGEVSIDEFVDIAYRIQSLFDYYG